MEERLTHGGAGGEARGADHAQGVPAQWAPPILLVETSQPVPMSLTVPHVSGPGCPPKRPRYPALGSTRRLAGLLALSTVACAPAEPRSGPPVAETDPATLADYGRCDESRAEGPLDLTGAVLTFADEFDRPSITGPDGDGPWFAPIHGGFGSAEFLPPHSTEPPFYFDNGVLTIRLAKRYRRWTLYLDDGSLRLAKRDGRWTSGILQSVNADGEGFTQRYGYFEMRAKFPKGNGTWPAFWLKSVNQFTDRSQTRAEIDIIEAYGGKDWSGYHAAVHLWPARNPGPEQLQKHWSQGCYERIEGDMFDGEWHLYGGEVGPEWVTMYYERREVGRFPTLAEFRHPLFILADLALNGKEPRTTDDHADMQIDYIRVWQRTEWSGRS
jgi:beta-glucanase (GH16 family)